MAVVGFKKSFEETARLMAMVGCSVDGIAATMEEAS